MRKLLVGLSGVLLALASGDAFAQTGTTNYGWLKPTIGASANTWGNNLNSDLDGIDSTVFGISGVANAACPKVGCTYTGAVTFSAAVTFGLTSTFTGLATFNGGISDNGNLSVTGTTTHTGAVTTNGGVVAQTAGTLPSVDAQTPNNATTGGLRIRANAASGLAYLQITDSGAGNEWGNFKFTSGAADTGPATWIGGLFTFNSAVTATGVATLSGGLSVSGSLTLPSASVVNADLDTVDTTPGTCGSSTTTCVATFNAQGRASSTSSTTIQPDTCSAGVYGYCKNAEGIITQWGLYDCGSSSCWSSTGTITQTFSVSCPNGFLSAQATGYNPGGVSSPRTPTIIGYGGSPVNQLYVRGDGASDEGFYWTVICH